jgi:hypothetical protein
LRRPAGSGARRISDHGGRKWSLSVRLRRGTGDALRYWEMEKGVTLARKIKSKEKK